MEMFQNKFQEDAIYENTIGIKHTEIICFFQNSSFIERYTTLVRLVTNQYTVTSLAIICLSETELGRHCSLLQRKAKNREFIFLQLR